jgi:hypothetical protein
MEAYIKYKRIFGRYTDEQLQLQFDELVSGGWEIITYNEDFVPTSNTLHGEMPKLAVTMVVGKKQSKIL